MSARKMILGIAAGAVLVAAYAAIPRHADLRAFDPAEMARLETAMWRDYYDKRYAALFYHLYESTRTQFGFSPFGACISRSAPPRRPGRSSRRGHGGRPMRPCRRSWRTTAISRRRRP